MANITTRQTAGTGATVKGSPLTNQELDHNFIKLNEEITGAKTYPTWEGNLDFGADVANTWKKIVGATLATGTYSTIAFRIEVIDPNGNIGSQTSINPDIETYYVACVRTEATTANSPDLCVVRGPGNRIRAIKTATGVYEIQIQNETQYREYYVKITSYASNLTHTITYHNLATAGTATATYTASVGTSTFFTENLTATNQITSTVTTGTAPLVVASTTRVSNLNVATAGTADTFTTARTINGVSFNGSANINVPNLSGSNGTTTLATTGVTSGVNYLTTTNSITGNAVDISTAGSDTNIGLTITTKGTGAITIDTGTGLGEINLKPGSSNVRIWDDNSSHYYQFVTGDRTANYNINLPAGNVTLTAGTTVVTDATNQTIAGTKTFSSPIIVNNTFDVNGSGPSQQINGLYIADLGSTSGTTLNPVLTAAIVGQVNTTRSIALSVDGSGYLWGFRTHTTASTYTFQSKTKFSDQLTTSRTLWGQSFSGAVNVTGNLTSVGNITGTAGLTLTATNATLGLTATGSNPIVFSVDNSERMRIANSGYIGIGTNLPVGTVDVRGTLFSENFGLINSSCYLNETILNDVQSWKHTEVSLSVSAQETEPRDIFFRDNGTKMFILGNTGNDITEYNLSTAWNIATATAGNTFSVGTQEGVPYGLFFKPDGLRFYIVGDNDLVYRYDMTVAWDITSASYVNSFSVSAQETSPQCISFSSDGTKMYILGTSGDDINQYNLSTAWDITTAAYSTVFSISAYETVPQGMSFSSDGTKVWIIGSAFAKIVQFDLATAWSISTASFTGFTQAGALGNYLLTGASGLYVNLTESKAWVCDYGNDRVFELETTVTIPRFTKSGAAGSKWLFEPNLEVEGNLQIDKCLNVGGISIFSSPLTCLSTLAVSSTATLSGSVTLGTTTGNINLGTSQTSGIITLGGTAQTGEMILGRSTGAQTISIATGITTTGVTKTINIGTQGASGSTTNITYGSGTSGSTTTQIWNSGGTEAMRLSAGNLGIGATSPSYALHVQRTSGNQNVAMINSGSTGSDTASFYTQASTGTSAQITAFGNQQAYIGANATTGLTFGNSANAPVVFTTNAAERMRIGSSGDVGVGTSSAPSGKLHAVATTTNQSAVVGNGLGTGYGIVGVGGNSSGGHGISGQGGTGTGSHGIVGQGGGSGGYGVFATGSTSGGYGVLGVAGTSDFGGVYGQAANGTIYGILGHANVYSFYGVGKLYNSDEVYIAGTTDQGAYNLQCNGTGVWGAGAYVNGSDIRIKQDIEPIVSALHIINALEPVTFKYKPEYSKDQSIQPGFIAQQLKTVMANEAYVDGVVQKGPEYFNVAYQSLVPLLTKAIQEQQVIIESLSRRIQALESK